MIPHHKRGQSRRSEGFRGWQSGWVLAFIYTSTSKSRVLNMEYLDRIPAVCESGQNKNSSLISLTSN